MKSAAYLAANLDLASAYGVLAAIRTTKLRMQKRKDCPLWLITRLDEAVERMNRVVIPALLARRKTFDEN